MLVPPTTPTFQRRSSGTRGTWGTFCWQNVDQNGEKHMEKTDFHVTHENNHVDIWWYMWILWLWSIWKKKNPVEKPCLLKQNHRGPFQKIDQLSYQISAGRRLWAASLKISQDYPNMLVYWIIWLVVDGVRWSQIYWLSSLILRLILLIFDIVIYQPSIFCWHCKSCVS